MPHLELLRLAGALAAPAFFALLALASLGAPSVAFICLLAGNMRRTQHHDAYARRLLRMALTCALPSLAVLAGGIGLSVSRIAWLGDWLLAAPVLPGLTLLAALAYCMSLTVHRVSRPKFHHGREQGLVSRTASLAALALFCLGLFLFLAHSLGVQIQAVLAAPTDNGLSVATLVRPNLREIPPLFWTAYVAAIPLAAACAGAASLEYLLLLRDREPFGRDAFETTVKLAARVALRGTLLAGALVPVLWSRISELPTDSEPARLLVSGCGLSLLLACALWAVLARSHRPSRHGLLIHGSLLLAWAALVLLTAAGLLCLYAV